MTLNRLQILAGAIALVSALGLGVVGVASAQTTTPPDQATPTVPTAPRLGLFGHGFGFGGEVSQFDTVATALNLTPTQLFEQLHSGKTLEEIATAQGVDLQKIQDALTAARTQAMKDRIAQAVKDGTITQAQADWMLQGIENGYMGGGKGFGFGHMRGGRHGGMGFGFDKLAPTTPATPSTGTSS